MTVTLSCADATSDDHFCLSALSFLRPPQHRFSSSLVIEGPFLLLISGKHSQFPTLQKSFESEALVCTVPQNDLYEALSRIQPTLTQERRPYLHLQLTLSADVPCARTPLGLILLPQCSKSSTQFGTDMSWNMMMVPNTFTVYSEPLKLSKPQSTPG